MHKGAVREGVGLVEAQGTVCRKSTFNRDGKLNGHVRLGCSTSFAERWFALLSIGIGLEKQSTPMISASPRCLAPVNGTFNNDAQGVRPGGVLCLPTPFSKRALREDNARGQILGGRLVRKGPKLVARGRLLALSCEPRRTAEACGE